MKNRSIITSVAVTLFAAFIMGCAKNPPELLLQAAKAALDSALTVKADKYAAADFTAAKESLDGAVAEIGKQNAAQPVKRDYTKAKAMLASATTSANDAKAKAADAKKLAADEAAAALTNANSLLKDIKVLVEKLPKTKKAEKKKMEGKITAAETFLAEAQTANAAGYYLTAREKANTCIAILDSVKTKLVPAPKKAPAKKKQK